MGYSKQFFVNSDFILGYQTINQSIENSDVNFDAAVAEHRADSGRMGAHNTRNTARVVMRVYGSTLAAGTGLGLLGSRMAPSGTRRLSTGIFFVPVFGFANWYGKATAIVTSSAVVPYVNCLSVFAATPQQQAGITVSCYDLQTGSFVLTDFDFSLTVWGDR
jgi:hypothetical protein